METKIIQISAGNGPIECAFVVAKVLKIFLEELKERKFEYIILYKENGIENTTLQSVSIQLKGICINGFLKDWLGTIKWIGVSTFRRHHKRRNWFIGCFEITASKSIEVKERDIQFQAIRSPGTGGQHVNKVSSAIRAKHLKSGLQVFVRDSRSQYQNKKIAIKRLREKVHFLNIEESKKEMENQWMNHNAVERGNPIRVFTGTDFKQKKRVKSFKKNRNQLKNDLRKQLE